ncbi:MAG: fasciclin domain-containing protein [Acetobacteraceae bacterium]
MKSSVTRSLRRAYFLAAVTVLAAGTAKQAAAADVASTLASDPQFSDFVTELRMIGLWPSIQNAHNVTIFAPTNTAFDKSRPRWRTELMDVVNDFNANIQEFAYQSKVLGAVINGVHPANDFTGKAQLVHSIGTTEYWVDGRNGAIQVLDKAPSTGEMGLNPAVTKTAQLSLPPSPPIMA